MNMSRTLTPTRLRQGILSDSEIDFLVREMHRMMDPAWGHLLDRRSEWLANHFRFAAVAQRCRDARASRGLSVKETAAALKLPQSRIKAIEAGHFESFDFAMLRRYIDHFGVASWFRRWCKANQPLVAVLSSGP